jgi:hypothetical protein
VPRTPWDDPDLQGTFTNKNEVSTPFERPAEFRGRRLEDISATEVAAILKKRDDDRPAVQAVAPGRIGPIEWQSQVDLTKGSRLWFVTSPLDGNIPPLTGEARTRVAARQKRQPAAGRVDSWLDLSLTSRCITDGLPASIPRPLRGRHAHRRDDELPGRKCLQRRESGSPSARGAIHAATGRQDRVECDGR